MNRNNDVYIFGARATAAGLYRALSILKPDNFIRAFLVSRLEGNVPEMWGCPVREISAVSSELTDTEKSEVTIYAAVPELIHGEICKLIEGYGFENIVMLTSKMEAELMGNYFDSIGRFRSVHTLKLQDERATRPTLSIYAASYYKDKNLLISPQMPPYVKKIYLGCNGALKSGVDIDGKADFYDNTGDNISEKNPIRCEMTAHYWVWKNRLDTDDDYVGICHYRRMLDLDDEDLRKVSENDVDIVLPYPMVHYPNASIHHTWYVPEQDWELMKRIVYEMYPEYGAHFDEVFSKPEFYNYNMLLAKNQVFADYCTWLFPILDKLEKNSKPKGEDRDDRYTAYLSESLMTLYFMANLNNLKIYHTGRILFT